MTSTSTSRTSTSRTSTSRRAALAAFAGMGLGAALPACGGDDRTTNGSRRGDGDLGTLTLQLNWLRDITFGGDYLMVERRLAEAAGFSGADLMVGGPAVAAEPIVASGRARFGYSSPELAAAARDAGAPLKIIGVGYQRNPFTVVSLAERPIAEPAALAGRTVAVDDVNQVVFSSFLRANGLTEDDVDVVPANFDTSLLVGRQVDGYLGYIANEGVTFELAGLDLVRLDLDDHGLPGAGQAYVTTERLLGDRPDVVEAALRAFVGGWQAFFGDLDAGIEVALRSFDPDTPAEARYVRRSAEVYRDHFVTDDTRANGLLTFTEARRRSVVDALALGGIDTTVDGLFDLSVLDRLYAEDPQLRAVPVGG